jgi:hypothetical protein
LFANSGGATSLNPANGKLDAPVSVVSFTNQLGLDESGWAQLAPFGDFPGEALLPQPDGSVKRFAAIQRLDRAAAEGMVAKFKSPWNRLKRYFTGCPIYVGHPDVPAPANEPADKSPKGVIVDLQVRENGLFCKPVFTSEGSELVESRRLRAFSAYWSASEVVSQDDADGALKIYRPEVLKSAGLTNHPNLPVQLLNEKVPPSTCLAPSDAPQPQPPTQPQNVNKQIILNFLAAHGLHLGADDTEIQIASALEQLGERVTAVQAELANERRFHAETLLEAALAAGAITAAQRPAWAERLSADFANASTALAQLPPVLKTRALTLGAGARKAELANATDRRDAVDTLVKAEMAVNGGDYPRAFAAVQRANPALFAEMKQPAWQ